MAPKPTTGRASLFRGKEGGDRVQGVLTRAGSTAFAHQKQKLGRLVGKDPEKLSDADVIEFLALGEEETCRRLGIKR